jgi:hypothetical protein
MKYHQIEPMCRPANVRTGQFLRGCPFDGLGCIGGERCSINSRDPVTASLAYNADKYGPDFICIKRIADSKARLP